MGGCGIFSLLVHTSADSQFQSGLRCGGFGFGG
jgi:hypothetical protein